MVDVLKRGDLRIQYKIAGVAATRFVLFHMSTSD